jgi:hypothetical protein
LNTEPHVHRGPHTEAGELRERFAARSSLIRPSTLNERHPQT